MLFIGSSITVLSMYTILTNYRFIIGNPLSPGESLTIKKHLDSLQAIESEKEKIAEITKKIISIEQDLKLKFRELAIIDIEAS